MKALGFFVQQEIPVRDASRKITHYQMVAFTREKIPTDRELAESYARYLERNGQGGRLLDQDGNVVREWKRWLEYEN